MSLSKKEEGEHSSLHSEEQESLQESLQVPSDPPPTYNAAPPANVSGSGTRTDSVFPADASFTIHKKNLSSLLIRTSAGPAFFVTIHSAFIAPDSTSIKIHKGATASDLLAATVDIRTKEGYVLMDIVGGSIATTALQQCGSVGRNCMFAMAIHRKGEVMEWHAVRKEGAIRGWQLIRAEMGEMLMDYKKSSGSIGRKVGEAKWTSDAIELGVTEGDDGMLIVTSLIGTMVRDSLLDAQPKAPWTRQEVRQLATSWTVGMM